MYHILRPIFLFLLLVFPFSVYALIPFPSINASLEYYPKENGNAPSLVAVIVPERLEGREIRGVEIPLVSSRATLPQPTGTVMFLNGGAWSASDWTCTIGSGSVRCSGSTSLQVDKKTCIALYLPNAIEPPSDLSLSMLGINGETLFTVGAELATTDASLTVVEETPDSQTSEQGIVSDNDVTNEPDVLSQPNKSGTTSRRDVFMYSGIALAVVGGGLLVAAKTGLFSSQPFIGLSALALGAVVFVYSLFIPQQVFFTWGCPNNCPKDTLQCRISYAITTSSDSVSTEEQNELEAQKLIASIKLLELPFTAIDRMDAWNADSILDLYKEVATEILGIPDAPGEVYGSDVVKGGLGLQSLGLPSWSVVDLDKIRDFTQGIHVIRQLADRATGGLQIFAHYEVDQCVESSCWVVSKQTNWKNKSSWFVPLSPEGTDYKHPWFDQSKPSGVFLWRPAVLAAMKQGNGDAVVQAMAQQALQGMPPACKAIMDAKKAQEEEDAWEPDPEIFKDPKGWLKKK